MPSEFKVLIAAALLAIVASLGKALFHMSTSPEQSEQTLRALTMRIGLSVGMFILLLGSWYFGLISPHGVVH